MTRIGHDGVEGPSSVAKGVEKVLRDVYDIPHCHLPPFFGEARHFKRDKEFCVGLLENPEKHPWSGATQHLSPRDSFSLAGSLFMLRKVLSPDSANEREALDKHRALLTSSPPSQNPDFLRFVQKEVASLFPPGWDVSLYPAACGRFSPSGSATLSTSRRKGGQSADLAGTEAAFLRAVLFGNGTYGCAMDSDGWRFEPSFVGRPKVRVSVVKENGKCRVVTAQDAGETLLKPLHEAIYDRLTKEKWCLRGDAKQGSFADFVWKEGEVFVSGDYESATDYLDIETSEYIMETILRNARMIPWNIRAKAMASFRSDLQYGKGDVVSQTRGQLMGNYLSFPLLCLRNYLSFRFAVRDRSVPVVINGDDIVFRSRPEVGKVWMEKVQETGLRLSKGKTLVDPAKFSLNSTFFLARRRKKPVLCPVIRAKSLLPRDSPPSGGAFLKFMSGWQRPSKFWERASRKVAALWLRCHRRSVDVLGRGVWGLGIPARPDQLHEAGLVPLQAYFNPSGKGRQALPVNPMPRTNERFGWRKAGVEEVRGVPRGVLKEWDGAVGRMFRHRAWTIRRDPEEGKAYWEEAKATGNCGYWAFSKLLKKGWRLLRLRDAYHLPLGNRPPAKQRKFWVPECWTQPRMAVIAFVKAT